MDIERVPLLSYARRLRARARNVALRDDARAVGMVGLSNPDDFAAATIVRLDIATGEDPGQRLHDAFTLTGARALWFYGGDDVARRAATDLDLSSAPCGVVFAHRTQPRAGSQTLTLRPPGARDRMTLSEMQAEHAPAFLDPESLFAFIGKDAVGVALSEALDAHWTEVRVVVYPAHRNRGLGTAILTALADRVEAAGRRVCAAIDTSEGRARNALESAGFRLADYYFTGRRER